MTAILLCPLRIPGGLCARLTVSRMSGHASKSRHFRVMRQTLYNPDFDGSFSGR